MMCRLIALAMIGCAPAATSAISAEKNPVVVMETSMGTMKIELYPDKAPITVKNFLTYVDDKFYDGTIFHRVKGKPSEERDFMIQGGGYLPGMKKKKTRDTIKNEASNGLSNQKYTIAMARTPEPDSASSEFYINVANNDFLDKKNDPDGIGYCVFGNVIAGMDVADKIKAVKTNKTVPVEDVIIKSVRRADK